MSKFAPGQSGNPTGRKPGSRNKSTLLREQIAGNLSEIIDALIAQAKAGDAKAARILLERVLPPLRAVDSPVAVPHEGGSLASAGAAVVAGMTTGEITPNAALAMLNALSVQTRLVEADDLVKRLD